MNFDQLINTIENVHIDLSTRAVKQVDYLMTIRNWVIGCYIVEFEQNGEDRADYGSKLLVTISEAFKAKQIIGFSDRNLRLFRQFYLTYPQIWQTVSAKFNTFFLPSKKTQPAEDDLMLPVETLINTLSFSHFIELLRLDTDLKRRFYEIEVVKNAWSVRDLQRAIDTLLFERTGLSTDKAGLIAKMKDNRPLGIKDIVKNPPILEFLGLEEKARRVLCRVVLFSHNLHHIEYRVSGRYVHERAFYLLLDLTHAIMTDENPFNLREEDVDLFDKGDR